MFLVCERRLKGVYFSKIMPGEGNEDLLHDFLSAVLEMVFAAYGDLFGDAPLEDSLECAANCG